MDRLLTLPQYVAPHHRLSRLAWRIARCTQGTVKRILIRSFVRFYDIDLADACRPEVDDYESFNDFFTRALRPGSRPLPPEHDAVVSPADGTVSQCGEISGGHLLQAKGRSYSLRALFAGDDALAHRFIQGSYCTIYLAPYNYHRVHAPVDATIMQVRYVPGRLFSVNDRTTRCVDALYARNERLVIEMRYDAGHLVMVLVGAMLVASMELAFCDVAAALATAPAGRPFRIEQPHALPCVKRGAELGRFNMGSTVILLAEPGRLRWEAGLRPGDRLQVGQALATWS
jgi:phosphatidylserine decarboxylase